MGLGGATIVRQGSLNDIADSDSGDIAPKARTACGIANNIGAVASKRTIHIGIGRSSISSDDAVIDRDLGIGRWSTIKRGGFVVNTAAIDTRTIGRNR